MVKTEQEFLQLLKISGFTIDNIEKCFFEMQEIIGIMDKLNGYEPAADFAVTPVSLLDLRQDTAQESKLEAGEVYVKRVVQSDD